MTKTFSTLALVVALSGGAAYAQSTSVADTAADAAKGAVEQTADAAKDAATKVIDSVTGTATEGAAAETAPAAAETAPAADATAPAADATTEAAPASDAAEGEAKDGNAVALDMGKEDQQDPTYVKETYGDWELKCFRTEGEEDPCQMFQLLKEDAGNPIAEFSLFRINNGGKAVAGATIVVPLGTLLTEEIKLSVDSGRPKAYSYSFCSLVGCYARIGLTADDVASLKNGAAAKLQIVPAQAPDQTVDIKMSLTGFTAAFENASVLQQ